MSRWNFQTLPCWSLQAQLMYPYSPAAYHAVVPKNSATFLAAFSRVMLFISTSTPMVCIFMASICSLVLSFMVFISFCLVLFPLRYVHITVMWGG